jgi:RNA polymerase sigma-70 factor (ECF subfamily)
MSSAAVVADATEGPASRAPMSGADLVDATLVLRAQAGDSEALAALAEQIRPTAQRFAVRFLGDPVRGEDIAQVALMKAFTRLADVRSPAAFPAWLMRIVRNECLNEISRRKNAQVPLSVLADEGTQIQAPAGGDDDPEEALLRSQLQELVRRVAMTLPEHHRQALIMRALEDRTYEEISEALDVPVSVARVWYFRARKRFRSAFVTMMVARRGVPALCQEMGEGIAAIIEGSLPADDRPRVQEHLAGCAVCRQTEDELRNTAFRTPTRAMILGLGLLRLGWRVPKRLQQGTAHLAPAAAKVAVVGAGVAALATVATTAGPPSTTPVVDTAPATLAPAQSGAGAGQGSQAPPAVEESQAATSSLTRGLPGLPDLLGVTGVPSTLQQVQGALNGLLGPLVSPSSASGTVTSTLNSVTRAVSPSPPAAATPPPTPNVP